MIGSSTIRCLVVAGLLLGGGSAFAADKADAEAAIAAAEAARAAAAEAKFEWTTTGPLIDEAKAAVAAGSFDDAVSLANQAKMQSDAAVAQAKNQHDAWKAAVVR
jgi:hypothetical protein